MTLDEHTALIASFTSVVNAAREVNPLSRPVGHASELELFVTSFANVNRPGDDEMGVAAVVVVGLQAIQFNAFVFGATT